jgi:hypothetical protein
MENGSSSRLEQDTGYTDDENSSSELGDRSMYENVGPDDGSIDGEEEDKTVDGDEADDADEDNVSEVAIYIQIF